MLTPQALERASSAYRRGYRDGSINRDRVNHDYAPGTFASFDYEEGYKAGQIDGRWNIKKEIAA